MATKFRHNITKQEFMRIFSSASPLEKQLLINDYIHVFDIAFIEYLLGIENNYRTTGGSVPLSNFSSSFAKLGLRENANENEIETVYRKLCLKYHPDKGGNARDFIAITKARNECLIKIKRR